ncbi:hypothetical protein BDC45DRAFT_531788 [Circinella umbellata]|nr:hypothetical protein BDC45DRAFT_531788 [Circinella umbellata]
MEELALKCAYEHPGHSLILDPSDKNWEKYFTTEELAEIRSFKAQSIPSMPMNLETYLGLYLNKKRTQSEADILRQVWGFIDHCYDESDIAVSLGEKGSRSLSEDRNNDRSIATVAPMQRKEVGTKVDILFTFCDYELVTAEAGKSSDVSSTKTFQESGIKCPKTMKSMFNNLLMRYPNTLRQLSTFGFVLSGLNINLLIMDSPSGHVCRISKLPQFLQYPTIPARLMRDLSLSIKLVWGTKKLMENVTNKITNASNIGSLDFTKPTTLPIPPLFNPTTTTKKNQRKRSNNNNSKCQKLSDQTNSSETDP